MAVVTALGPAHLDTFGTLERIAQEKAALVREVPPSGLVVLGSENRYASEMAQLTSAEVICVKGRGRELSYTIAYKVGGYFKLSEKLIDHALSELGTLAGRLNVLDLEHVTVIDDAYNANPLSMTLGLDTLAEIAEPHQRKLAILGEMGELGTESPRYHGEIAAYARERADVVIGVGELAKHYRPDHWFATGEAFVAAAPALIRRGDCLLVKGSHAAHLDRVVQQLKPMFSPMYGGQRPAPRSARRAPQNVQPPRGVPHKS